MTEPFEPKLVTTDWNEEWKAMQAARKHPDDPTEWNARAKTFPTSHGPQSTYVDRFLELAGIRPNETVFDMGCGTGALATPLAEAGHHVIAADFSSGMLEKMRAEQDRRGIDPDLVRIVQMSWSDDWAAHGVTDGCADVAVASRSIATFDLKDSLLRLTRAARRRVCITLPCSVSPRIDARLLRAAGLQRQLGSDFVYAFNILAAEGVAPEVAYIPSKRYETFDSLAEAQDSLAGIVRSAARSRVDGSELDRACERVRAWVADNLVENPHAGEIDHHGVEQKRYRLRESRQITWAFLAWDAQALD